MATAGGVAGGGGLQGVWVSEPARSVGAGVMAAHQQQTTIAAFVIGHGGCNRELQVCRKPSNGSACRQRATVHCLNLLYIVKSIFVSCKALSPCARVPAV